MGCCKYVCAILALLTAYGAYSIYQCLFTIPPIPDLPNDQWWGPGSPPKSPDTTIRPFKVEFSKEEIVKLKKKLADTAFLTEPLEGIGFQYGFNTKYLKELVEFWRTKYNFTERERKLNSLPQFKTNIQGLDIHYVHMTQTNPKKLKVIPILLLHGWPGSYVEFYQTVMELSTDENEKYDFVFTFVIPSLPGYGYSQGASKPGLGAAQIAVVLANLMERLGYSKYVIQGGDWGSIIGKILAVIRPEHVIGYHTNMPFANTPLSSLKHLLASVYPTMLVEEKHVSKMFPILSIYQFLLEETGYLHLQATKPDTIGVALRDSPIGLAAYLLEKFSTATDKQFRSLPDGGLTKKFDLSDLLDNIMIYWDSGSITTSIRLYAETFNKAQYELKFDRIPVRVPVAIMRCSNEIGFSSKCQLSEVYTNILRLTDVDDVGHFAAFQNPKKMAQDIWESVDEFNKFHSEKNAKKNNEL